MAEESRNPSFNELIWDRLAPQIRDLFIHKGLDYGDGAEHLGLPGQFADINRKFWKLKRSMWEGEPLVGEGAREVLMDLIGHCLLSIDMIDRMTYNAETSGGIVVSHGAFTGNWAPGH